MKIALTSTVSCGKTTLIKELAKLERFSDYKVAVERSEYLRDLGIPLNTDSTIGGQCIFGSERISELFHENLLTDRSIIDVMAFTNLAESINSVDKEAFEEFYSRFIPDYDYIFYISPEGIEIEHNGVRETNPEYRSAIDIEINRLISKYKYKMKNLYEIKGLTSERVKQVLEIISL